MVWKYKKGKGIWQEHVNEHGESSIIEHNLKTLIEGCSNHFWEVSDAQKHELACKNCKIGTYWNFGTHDLINGQLIPKIKTG